MRNLTLLPERSGFSATLNEAGDSVSLDGAARSFSSHESRQAWNVRCNWAINGWEYNYLMAFWRTGTSKGSLPFLANLPLENTDYSETYRCQFIKPPKLNRVQGELFIVSGEFEAMAQNPLSFSGASDETLAANILT